MKRKHMLMDFYLQLLSIPHADKWRIEHGYLYADVLFALSEELGVERETVQLIFERMASEDYEATHR